MNDQENAARAMIKAIYEDGEAEINGRVYTFNKMTHKQRRKVFAYYTHVAAAVQSNDFSFLDTPAFEPVEDAINKAVSVKGSLLSKISDAHWLDYPEDYITFIGTAMGVISYPFLQGSSTG